MTFQWTITKDLIGTDQVKDVDGKLPCHFRLKDDDGQIYYHGETNDMDSERAFIPLDWAMGYAGCTSIEYLRNGRWEVL